MLIGPIVPPIASRSAALTSFTQSFLVYLHPYHTTLVFYIHRTLVLRSTTSTFYVEQSPSFTVFTVVITTTNQPTTSDWECQYPLVTSSHNITLSTSTPKSQPPQHTILPAIFFLIPNFIFPCNRYAHRLVLLLSLPIISSPIDTVLQPVLPHARDDIPSHEYSLVPSGLQYTRSHTDLHHVIPYATITCVPFQCSRP